MTARADLAEWQERAARREVSPGSFAKIEPGILAYIAQLEERERRLITPSVLSWLLDGASPARARWDAADVPMRRRAAQLLCSPDYLGWLKVGKSPVPRRPVPVHQRVTWDCG